MTGKFKPIGAQAAFMARPYAPQLRAGICGTVTGRLRSTEPQFTELPRHPGSLSALARAVAALQGAGACVLALGQPQAAPCPATGRPCPSPGLCSEPTGCVQRRAADVDYSRVEERVLAYMADGGTFEEASAVSLAAWADLVASPEQQAARRAWMYGEFDCLTGSCNSL